MAFTTYDGLHRQGRYRAIGQGRGEDQAGALMQNFVFDRFKGSFFDSAMIASRQQRRRCAPPCFGHGSLGLAGGDRLVAQSASCCSGIGRFVGTEAQRRQANKHGNRNDPPMAPAGISAHCGTLGPFPVPANFLAY